MTRETKTGRSWTPLVDQLAEGGYVGVPIRSGGPFDPVGPRSCDVTRADDLVALVEAHPGRWLMITLTCDRSIWLSPEAAYQRCNERVREVTRAISREGVHATAFEVQGKTGAGWPHWHVIVWAPDKRKMSELRSKVERAWAIREVATVDEETGEVTSWVRVRIGWTKVERAKTREGIARYIAKYCVKRWEAIPRWMGDSSRQLRKLRLSRRSFLWLASVGRHTVKRGGRRRARSKRRRARKLFDRMAWSGQQLAVYRRDGRRLRFVRTLPVPATKDGVLELESVGGRPLNLGRFERVRWDLSEASVVQLDGRLDHLRRLQLAEVRRRRVDLAEHWDRLQGSAWHAGGT